MSCGDCGMATRDPGEYHPHAFCVLFKSGYDPWEILVTVNGQLGVDTTHWPKRPPLIRDLPYFQPVAVGEEA